jgi:hypothetical protein
MLQNSAREDGRKPVHWSSDTFRPKWLERSGGTEDRSGMGAEKVQLWGDAKATRNYYGSFQIARI